MSVTLYEIYDDSCVAKSFKAAWFSCTSDCVYESAALDPDQNLVESSSSVLNLAAETLI